MTGQPQFKRIPTMTSSVLKPKKKKKKKKKIPLINVGSVGGGDGQFQPVHVTIFNLQFIIFGFPLFQLF
jgi:hypothetical protein